MEEPRFVPEEREYLKIRLDPENVKKTIWPHETVIYVYVGETRYQAMVPTRSLGEDNAYVPAQQVAKRNGNAVIVLPVGNDGTTKWYIPEDRLSEILFD